MKLKKLSEINAIGGLELGAVPLTGITIAKTPKRVQFEGFYSS